MHPGLLLPLHVPDVPDVLLVLIVLGRMEIVLLASKGHHAFAVVKEPTLVWIGQASCLTSLDLQACPKVKEWVSWDMI